MFWLAGEIRAGPTRPKHGGCLDARAANRAFGGTATVASWALCRSWSLCRSVPQYPLVAAERLVNTGRAACTSSNDDATPSGSAASSTAEAALGNGQETDLACTRQRWRRPGGKQTTWRRRKMVATRFCAIRVERWRRRGAVPCAFHDVGSLGGRSPVVARTAAGGLKSACQRVLRAGELHGIANEVINTPGLGGALALETGGVPWARLLLLEPSSEQDGAGRRADFLLGE